MGFRLELSSACLTPGLISPVQFWSSSGPVLVPTIKQRSRQAGECPKEGQEDDGRAGEPAL